MKEVQLIANDYPSRMKEILDEAWKVFKWQFANKAFVKEIENEAPFQLHFASIIRSIGNMYVLHGETFYVDLETKWEGKTDESCEKKKYIDITCGFYKFGEAIPQYACAIELKFKRKDYGALPHNLFAIYKDIESIESEVLATGEEGNDRYSEGRLYFITNNSDYCYWNSMDASGVINKTKWTYNVGVMIQNGVCLYEITGDEAYLNDAKSSAKGSYTAFVRSVSGIGMAYPDHDPWFNTKLLRGYIDLAEYEEEVRSYIDVYADFINYGYDHARTAEGFFYEDWTGKDPKRASQLLMQDAVIESYAALALYYNEND